MSFRAPIVAKPLLDEYEYSPSSDLEGTEGDIVHGGNDAGEREDTEIDAEHCEIIITPATLGKIWNFFGHVLLITR
jgi:hypothetical protein